jgi:hypothetical protein
MRPQKREVSTTTTTTDKPDKDEKDKSKLGKVSLTLFDAMTMCTNVNPPSDIWPKESSACRRMALFLALEPHQGTLTEREGSVWLTSLLR